MSITIRSLLVNLANIFLGIVLFFLGLRIMFRLFLANSSTPFVSWVYGVSDYFMRPFNGIFRTLNVNGSPIDVSEIIALIMYAILVYVFIALINSTRSQITTSYERHGHVHE